MVLFFIIITITSWIYSTHAVSIGKFYLFHVDSHGLRDHGPQVLDSGSFN